MANLVIDEGNTSTKMCVIDGEKAHKTFHYDSFFSASFVEIINEWKIDRAIISSTRNTAQLIASALRQYIPHIVVIGDEIRMPLGIDESVHEPVGADRLAFSVGAMACYGDDKDYLLIDLGTAITVDYVEHGIWRGGNISPGVRMRFLSMHEHTAALPLFSAEDFDNSEELGNSTLTCMARGVINGIVYELEGYIELMTKKNPQIMVIICGGDAKYFVNRIKNATFVGNNVIYLGLNKILNYNVE